MRPAAVTSPRPPGSRKKGRSVARFGLFLAIVVGAVALLFFLRRPKGPRAATRTPTGGAASLASDLVSDARARSVDGDNDAAVGESIVEDARRYAVKIWSFGLDRYDLRVEDAAMTTALDTVLTRTKSDFVVNGGFFDETGKPVGLVISDGAVLSKLGRNLSGGVLTSDGSRAELFASEGFSLPDGGRFAIQCRPRLVVDRTANVKSDDGKRAERTALCTRDAGRTVDVVIVRGSDDGESPGPSLFALSRHLVDAGCESALNLDGGPSTGAAWREGDAVRLLAPRGPVRHVIAFSLRDR